MTTHGFGSVSCPYQQTHKSVPWGHSEDRTIGVVYGWFCAVCRSSIGISGAGPRGATEAA